MSKLQQIVDSLTEEEKCLLSLELEPYRIKHPIEQRLQLDYHLILDSLNKKSAGLTFRMLRGIIAETAFEKYILESVQGLKVVEFDCDLPYDFMVDYRGRRHTIQVKLVRSERDVPKFYSHNRRPTQLFAAETQKTRGGKNPLTGEDTRPYRAGEFDILAIAMQPVTGN